MQGPDSLKLTVCYFNPTCPNQIIPTETNKENYIKTITIITITIYVIFFQYIFAKQ